MSTDPQTEYQQQSQAPPYTSPGHEVQQAPPQEQSVGSYGAEKAQHMPTHNMGQQQQQQQQWPQQGMPQQGGPAPGQGFQTAVPIQSLGPGPAPIDCPACGMRQMTRIQCESGNTTYAWALGLCICFCLGCIPFCINSLKDVAHFCGHCGVRVATYHRSGATEQHIHR